MNKRMMKIGLVLLSILLFGLGTAYAAGIISCAAVLGGKVSPAELAKVGQQVTAGQVLVNVETLSGLTPSIQAPIDGVVREVLVKSGQNIVSGEIVLKIEGKN